MVLPVSLFVYSPCKFFPYSNAFFLYCFKSSLGVTSLPVISIGSLFRSFSMRPFFVLKADSISRATFRLSRRVVASSALSSLDAPSSPIKRYLTSAFLALNRLEGGITLPLSLRVIRSFSFRLFFVFL